jgi:N-acetylglutamate synthase-like GNAT family acetyltransferase
VTVDFNTGWNGFTTRPAEAQDVKAVRMLLADARQWTTTIVAVDRQHGLLIGAAAMTASCRNEPFKGPGVALEVVAPCRRRGVAKCLLAQLEAAARHTFDADGLYASQRVDQDSAKMQGWRWLGFQAADTVEEHVLPIDQFEPRLGPLVDRMRARGRIPASARIVPLYQANAAAVLQLHLDQMGGDRGDLYRKLRGKGAGAFHPRYSRVLLIDNAVKGCVLAHRASKHTAQVDAVIVEPALRGGWANAWLKLEASRRALLLGIREFSFTSFSHYSDTRSFTDKLGGTTIRKSVLMVRPLASPN